MHFHLYDLILLFFIYSFLGWCLEVSYAAIKTGKFVNRGFLYGTVCPIYGLGALIVIISLNPIKNNILLLFLASILLTSFLEFLAGFLLEKIFQNKWWDYSDLPYNLKGYICLKFSIYWGIACIFIIKFIQPFIYTLINAIPIILGKIIIMLLILFIIVAIMSDRKS
ncbi:putative ABC transporter permease, partial [Caproiciproducens sp. MSJ-32]|uniref:putative ABC transporter permease n=1 Tax=Caproiciproducens sp. MSJ-32 TaxID=2841527 RepID=UPI001C11FAC7